MKKFSPSRPILLALALGSFAFAGDSGLDKFLGYISYLITVGVIILVVLLVASWIYLPLLVGYMALSFYKKRSEQSHEDNSLKAAGVAFVGGIIGMIFAYVIVGTIGQYASGGSASDLSGGNKYMVQSIFKPVMSNMSNRLQTGG